MTIDDIADAARVRLRRALDRHAGRRRPHLYGVAIHAMPPLRDGGPADEVWGCGPTLAITTRTETLPLTAGIVQSDLGGQYWWLWGEQRLLLTLATPCLDSEEAVSELHLTAPVSLRGGTPADYSTLRTIVRPHAVMGSPLILLAPERPPGLPR